MHLNTDPAPPARMPSILDYSALIAPTGLLPETLVKLVPLEELERRCEEINTTHPQFREETPLVLAGEQKRRHVMSQGLRVSTSRIRVA